MIDSTDKTEKTLVAWSPKMLNLQVWKPVELVNDPKSREKFDPESGVTNLTFKAPFPAETDFKLVLPKSLKDEIGRVLVNLRRLSSLLHRLEFLR